MNKKTLSSTTIIRFDLSNYKTLEMTIINNGVTFLKRN